MRKLLTLTGISLTCLSLMACQRKVKVSKVTSSSNSQMTERRTTTSQNWQTSQTKAAVANSLVKSSQPSPELQASQIQISLLTESGLETKVQSSQPISSEVSSTEQRTSQSQANPEKGFDKIVDNPTTGRLKTSQDVTSSVSQPVTRTSEKVTEQTETSQPSIDVTSAITEVTETSQVLTTSTSQTSSPSSSKQSEESKKEEQVQTSMTSTQTEPSHVTEETETTQPSTFTTSPITEVTEPSHVLMTSTSQTSSPSSSKQSEEAQKEEQPQTSMTSTQTEPSHVTEPEKPKGVAGIDYPTSDGFLFDGSGIKIRTDQGLMVDHAGHLHWLPFSQLRGTKWEYLIKGDNQPSESQTKPSSEVVLTPEIQAKIEAKIARILRVLGGVTRDQIKVDLKNNTITYPHGDHHHIDVIDETKPIGGISDIYNFLNHDLPGDPSIETQAMIGPIFVNSDLKRDLLKWAIVKNNPNLPIKDINNYHAVSFVAPKAAGNDQSSGQLQVGDQTSQAVVYLVLKGKSLSELGISAPQVLASQGYFFKDWSSRQFEEGILDQDWIVRAQFRKEEHREGPKVVREEGAGSVNLDDYHRVQFTTFNLGSLALGEERRAGFTYYVRKGLTWSEALDNGLELPETLFDQDRYEFIGWRGSAPFPNGDQLDSPMTTSIYLAKFGLTRPVIGSYIPTDGNNPLDKQDPARPHPNNPQAPYHSDNYLSVSFDAGDGAVLKLGEETSRQRTYLVRKGTIWQDFISYMPELQVTDDQTTAQWTEIIPRLQEDVEEGIYQPTVTRIETDTDQEEPTDSPETSQSGEGDKQSGAVFSGSEAEREDLFGETVAPLPEEEETEDPKGATFYGTEEERADLFG